MKALFKKFLCSNFYYFQLSGVGPPPLYRGAVGGEGSPKSTANAVVQAPRRKVMDEGKLRKVVIFIFRLVFLLVYIIVMCREHK